MLAGKGFGNVINMSGGIKAWQGHAAIGGEDLGLDLFTGDESPEATLVVAYSLEEGLKDFYLSMVEKVENAAVKDLFRKLSTIEDRHKDAMFEQYLEMTGAAVSREEFETGVLADTVEGGLSTDSYISRFNPDLESPVEVISLAMAIEAQALDMYQRVSDKVDNEKSSTVLARIAREEKAHLDSLGRLMDSL